VVNTERAGRDYVSSDGVWPASRVVRHNAQMSAELPLVARAPELAVLTDAVEAAMAGTGEIALIMGEAGVGKTRLLSETRRMAERKGLLVLKGRAIESGGAYRPLVEAFARPSASFAQDPRLTAARPTLARVLPGWTDDAAVLAPMADPAAVLAEALIALLEVMGSDGAVLILDDLQWADEDTLSVLSYLVDSVDDLPLAVVLASRAEPQLPPGLGRLDATRSIRRLPLKRLTSQEVADALKAAELPNLEPEMLDQLTVAIDGLPLVLDEFVRQLRESQIDASKLDVTNTTLPAAVQLRVSRLAPASRAVLDALSVLGETKPELLAAATGLDDVTVVSGIHDGLASTLLVPAATKLGVTWRHRLMRDAVRNLLLPLEQQTLARRAANHLMGTSEDLDDGQLRQAASWCELAGYPDQAAQQLIRAARAAIRHGGLSVAQQYLAHAQSLTGSVPEAAEDVLIERIQVLTLAGQAGEAYHSGRTALDDVTRRDQRRLVLATARAAVVADLQVEAAELLARIDDGHETTEPDIAVLRAHVAHAARQSEAIALGEHAAAVANRCGRFDLACEAWVIVGRAVWRLNQPPSTTAFQTALSLSKTHELPIWEVRALAELGTTDMVSRSDATRFHQARGIATAVGMAGMVAFLDMWIGLSIAMRDGFISAYPILARADAQARQLRLVGLHAQTRAHIAHCLVDADGQPLPGLTGLPSADDVLAEAIALGEASKPVHWARGALGLRAWFHGDSSTAIRLFEESLAPEQNELKQPPWWGVWALLRTVTNAEPEEALEVLAAKGFTGHHLNRAALAYGRAVLRLQNGRPAHEFISEGDQHARQAPLMMHLLHTVIAPTMFREGVDEAHGWLLEADAFCRARGERALQRRVRAGLREIGAKIPRAAPGIVSPDLARIGMTPREIEILRLVNSGLSNTDIASQLFLSVRTVETHVSSMLQKTGFSSREQLPSAD
jgi:DNA-binding CsgD family transcriptional regulator